MPFMMKKILPFVALVSCEKAPFKAPESPPEWSLQVLQKDSKKSVSKITPFVFKQGDHTCYVFIQDFGATDPSSYRANLTSSCVRN